MSHAATTREPARWPSAPALDVGTGAGRLVRDCLVLAALLVAYHFALRWLLVHTGLVLAAVGPGRKVYRLVPLYMYWRPHVRLGLVIALGVLTAFIVWLRRRSSSAGSARWMVPALMAWHVSIACGVAATDASPRKWLEQLARPYEVLVGTDYIGAVPRVTTVRGFLHDYGALMPALPMHCQTHPPGGVLMLWAIASVFGKGPLAAALVTILASSLAVPAVYLLARDLLGQRLAYLAVAFYLLAPTTVLFTATCIDAVFSVLFVWSMYWLWRARHGRPVACGVAGGLATAATAVCTFTAAWLALWSLVVLVVTAAVDRPRLRNMLIGFSVAVATASAVYAVLYAWSGYNPLEVLATALADQAHIMGTRGHATWRQHLHFSIGNLAAFAIGVGLPMTILWLRHCAALMHRGSDTAIRCFTLSLVIALAVFDAMPLFTLETERVWIFLVPLVAVGAAERFRDESNHAATRTTPLVAFVLLAAQTVLMELLLETIW